MKKAAIPIANEKISEYMNECSYFELYDLEAKDIRATKSNAPVFENAEDVRLWLEKNEISDVILHRAKKELLAMLASSKINLFVGVPLASGKQIIEAYQCGKLESDKNIITEITN
ncbi:hypothetical protein SLH46_10515 [Draconibacterium sp. IB214405]|uniref:hypothetical protein n=1 Tax=Draconibacterium sp. IB214405 TaxID=3097352 RepID=UPI002A1716A9|nr:hypothetical protein [Draconibacterium sp. IB214405]MDX8339617.1 hypothetical protein [Draconibacterium sp. IB214405]